MVSFSGLLIGHQLRGRHVRHGLGVLRAQGTPQIPHEQAFPRETGLCVPLPRQKLSLHPHLGMKQDLKHMNCDNCFLFVDDTGEDILGHRAFAGVHGKESEILPRS